MSAKKNSAPQGASATNLKAELARKARVERAKNDLAFFRRTYMLGADSKPFVDGPHHVQMDSLYHETTNLCICAPVGFAKSEWLKSVILWEIARDRNTHAVYVSHSLSIAKNMMMAIAENLRSNEKLIEDFGQFYTDDAPVWSGEKISVIGNKNPRVPTFTVIGAGGRIENWRGERMYTDDVVTLDSATSEAERKSIENWFFNEFYTRLNKGGKVCMIGSRFHPQDLYNKLATDPQKSKEWRVVPFKAVLNWDTGQVLWPERWSFEDLKKRRDAIGTPNFEARYQQNPEALYAAYFTPDMLEDRIVSWDGIKSKDIKVIFQGWDFSISEKETADYTAGVCVGVTADGDWVILDVFRQHLSRKHAEAMIEFYRKWRNPQHNIWNAPIQSVFAEKNMFQQLIGVQAAQLEPTIPLVPVQRVRDKMQRILRIQPFFQQKRMWILKSIPFLFEHLLQQELFAFPSEGTDIHDDFLDALEAAMSYATTAQHDNKIRVLGGLDSMTRRFWA